MRRRVVGVLLCAFAMGALACGRKTVEAKPVVRPVKILEIRGARSSETREYPGTIAATHRAELAFEVPGRIVALPVKEGMQVEQGQVLARLDARDYQARLDSERADLENARVEYERAQTLYREGVLAKAELDRRRAAFQVADAAEREARKAFEETRLRAPFTGQVARRLVDRFQNVQAKQPILLLQDQNALEVKVAIPERDLATGRGRSPDAEEANRRLHARVVITSLPDRSFPARITELATAADPTTRTFQATLTFQPPAAVGIHPGMTAKVVVDVSRHGPAGRAIEIPAQAALADETGTAYVWRIDPSSMEAHRLPVVLGALSGSNVAVTSGLEPGDWIAVSGVHELREGMKVRRYESSAGT